MQPIIRESFEFGECDQSTPGQRAIAKEPLGKKQVNCDAYGGRSHRSFASASEAYIAAQSDIVQETDLVRCLRRYQLDIDARNRNATVPQTKGRQNSSAVTKLSHNILLVLIYG